MRTTTLGMGSLPLGALVLAAAFLSLSCAVFERSDLPQAKDFNLTLFANAEHHAGEQVSLSDFSGNPVVLNFWFPSCPPCVAEMPEFEKIHQKYKGDDLKVVGVQFLGLDSATDGQEFVKRMGVNYYLGPDQTAGDTGKITLDYRISGFPTTVFLDRDHRIKESWTGGLTLEKLEELTLSILH